jgi:chromosome segregation protein
LKLRAIETVGFKSFADKTELNFVDGITAIVGPNGSGKSNVSDAVRWVLGEQSMRALRGNSMEDVIFSGSGKRHALNMAEVTLCFANADGALPVAFQEVSVSRRIFRTGDSAYFINKAPCRLKDIHDLFADTGLGRGSLSIIGQNKIDEILNNRPEDRRALFEEAAGITRYKWRKKEAARRLEETDNNIIRLNDIRFELGERLEPMRESAEKAMRHNELSQALKECRITAFVRKIDRSAGMRQTARAQLEALKQEEETLAAGSSINDNKVFMLVGELEKVSSDMRTIQQKMAAVQASIEKLSGQKAVLSERIRQNEERAAGVDENKSRLANGKAELEKELGDIKIRLAAQKKGEKAAGEDKGREQARLLETNRQIAEIEKEQRAEQDDVFERKRNILQINNDIRAIETAFNVNVRRKEKLSREKAGIEENIHSLQAEIDGYLKTLARHEEEKNKLLLRSRESGKESDFLKIRLKELAGREKKAETDMLSLKARTGVLEKLQSEYDGFNSSVKRLMTANASWRHKLIGTVAQLLDVPAQYVPAVEIALGAAIQNIVAEDDLSVRRAIEFLKSEKAGRATFLPLNRLRIAAPGGDDLALASACGIIGFADKLVKCAAKVRPAVEFLLGRTLIAADLDAALKVRHSGRLRIVTLDGDVIYAGGTMSGGSRSGKESGFLSRNQEIAENREKILAMEKNRDETARAKEEMLAALVAAEKKIGINAEKINGMEVETAKITAHRNEAEKSKKQLELGLATLAFEYNEITGEDGKLATERERLAIAKGAAEAEDLGKYGLADELKNRLEELKIAREEIRLQYNDANIRYETAQKATELLAEQYDGLTARMNQAAAESERLEGELGVFRNTAALSRDEQERLEARILEERRELEEVKGRLDETAAEQLRLLPLQAQLEKTGKEIKSNLNAVQSRLRNAEAIFARHETEFNMTIEQLQDAYALDIDEARKFCRSDFTESALDDEMAGIENRLNLLGPVNPAAIEEYKQLQERHDFLTAQHDDLAKAKEGLGVLIRDIDRTMSKLFREAFAAINGHFQTTFVRLFGGGTAGLEMIEPGDVLNTGIEVIAQPPGKKLQTLSLLSGGERALTVIALLFAMLSYRPAPFCVLDEIDAALDEANADRFVNFLTDYARKTQFIIITHRKTTMQAADLLHGITMEESGVSKLISVKLLDRNEASA